MSKQMGRLSEIGHLFCGPASPPLPEDRLIDGTCSMVANILRGTCHGRQTASQTCTARVSAVNLDLAMRPLRPTDGHVSKETYIA
jgi:hypothetical protein